MTHGFVGKREGSGVRWLSAGAILLSLVLLASCSKTEEVGSSSPPPGAAQDPNAKPDYGADFAYATTPQVLDAVKAAVNVSTVPSDIAQVLGKTKLGGPHPYFDLQHFDNGGSDPDAFGDWAYGDPKGEKLMVVYGDSRATMWSNAAAGVAAKNGWQLRVFGLSGCPVLDLKFQSIQTKSPNTKCDTFRDMAVAAIQQLKPAVIVVSSVANQFLADGSYPKPAQWEQGWQSTFGKLSSTGAKMAMMGDLPSWKNATDRCLAANLTDVQACSVAATDAKPSNLYDSERAAADASGVLYVPTNPWICADRCEPIIADKLVYHDQFHLTKPYTEYLTGAVGEALKPLLS